MVIKAEEPEHFKPVKVAEVELAEPLPEISASHPSEGIEYQKALLLVRIHTYPIGLINIEFTSGIISQSEMEEICWVQYGEQINQHLAEDGLGRIPQLSPGGITSNGEPKCLVHRQESLKDAPLISVIIATRDRVHSLVATLNSLIRLEYPRFEVILVDNAPKTTETYNYFLEAQKTFQQKGISLRYIREEVPGLAVAHNRGLDAVHGPFVAFTDDDVVVDKHWLTEIWRGFNAAEQIGCVTGLVIPLELTTPAQVLFEEFGGFTKGFFPRVYDLSAHRPDDALFPYTAGRFGTGANMAFRTESLLQLGGFDPALGIGTPALGADDMAAFWGIINHENLQLVYHPSALVYHQHRRAYDALIRQMNGYGVGLTAFFTSVIVNHPKKIFEIVPKLPGGLKYAFTGSSLKNQRKSEHYPPELESTERRGMVYGPFAYLTSKWQYRKQRRPGYSPRIFHDPALAEHFIIQSEAKMGDA